MIIIIRVLILLALCSQAKGTEPKIQNVQDCHILLESVNEDYFEDLTDEEWLVLFDEIMVEGFIIY